MKNLLSTKHNTTTPLRWVNPLIFSSFLPFSHTPNNPHTEKTNPVQERTEKITDLASPFERKQAFEPSTVEADKSELPRVTALPQPSVPARSEAGGGTAGRRFSAISRFQTMRKCANSEKMDPKIKQLGRGERKQDEER